MHILQKHPAITFNQSQQISLSLSLTRTQIFFFKLNSIHELFNRLGDEAPVPDDGIKPTFTERPVIRQSDDGGKITFECRCVGDPKPTIQW